MTVYNIELKYPIDTAQSHLNGMYILMWYKFREANIIFLVKELTILWILWEWLFLQMKQLQLQMGE